MTGNAVIPGTPNGRTVELDGIGDEFAKLVLGVCVFGSASRVFLDFVPGFRLAVPPEESEGVEDGGANDEGFGCNLLANS